MSLIRWSPQDTWDPFRDLVCVGDEMNRLLDLTRARCRTDLAGVWAPAVDVQEDEHQFTVQADLPGMTREQVTVSVLDDVLQIRGERKEERREGTKKDGVVRCERSVGAFERVLQFPVSLDAAKVSAQYRDGVLDITLPKAEHAKPKQIEVKLT